jgi:hypothetical protein
MRKGDQQCSVKFEAVKRADCLLSQVLRVLSGGCFTQNTEKGRLASVLIRAGRFA